MLSAEGSYAQISNSSDPFFFIQMTDPQFGFIDPASGFVKETELYEKAVVKINDLNPAFVVITGDLTHIMGDKAQIDEFKRITGMINKGIPVYLIPGNHDIGDSLNQKDVDLYLNEFGDTKFSFEYKGSRFIGINTTLMRSGKDQLEQEQFDWFQKELSGTAGNKHIVIFAHHPIFMVSADEPDNSTSIPLARRTKYIDLFRKYRVDAIFAGHTHRNGNAQDGDMEMIITSAVGRPLGKDPSGFRVVKVYNEKLESFYYGLEEVPLEITFDK